MTPEQAKRLWCPFTQRANPTTNAMHQPSTNCVAEMCAAWRWKMVTVITPGGTVPTREEPMADGGYCALIEKDDNVV